MEFPSRKKYKIWWQVKKLFPTSLGSGSHGISDSTKGLQASKQGDVDGDIICQYIRQVMMQSRMEEAKRWYMTTASGSASGRGKLLGTKIVLIYAHPWVLFG